MAIMKGKYYKIERENYRLKAGLLHFSIILPHFLLEAVVYKISGTPTDVKRDYLSDAIISVSQMCPIGSLMKDVDFTAGSILSLYLSTCRVNVNTMLFCYCCLGAV